MTRTYNGSQSHSMRDCMRFPKMVMLFQWLSTPVIIVWLLAKFQDH